jgi:hypothetical protein
MCRQEAAHKLLPERRKAVRNVAKDNTRQDKTREDKKRKDKTSRAALRLDFRLA